MPPGYELERLNQQYLQGEILNKFADSDLMQGSTDYQESAATSPKKFLSANQGRIASNISNHVLSRLNTSFDVRSNSYMPGFGVTSVQKLHHRPLTQQAIYGTEAGAHTSGRSPKQSLDKMS